MRCANAVCTDKKLKASVPSLWSGDQSSLEGLKRVHCGKVLWKAVPQSDIRGKEGELIHVYPAEQDQEPQVVASGAEVCRAEERKRDVYEVVDYPGHHHQLRINTAFL